ncbi:AAA family ATPase, partial [Candidatus Woesearchaeota archaeon]|nr:AAA family ATPase [Candidatus Woesearchaeota archaeon]
ELKKDRDQAMKYKDMSDRIRTNKASYLKIQIDRKEKEKSEVEDRLARGEKELEKIKAKIMSLKQENESKKAQIEEITKDIEKKGEVEQVRLNKEIESLKIELTKKHSRSETCRSETGKVRKRREDLKRSMQELEEKITQLGNEKAQLEENVLAKEKERDQLHKRLIVLKKKSNMEDAAGVEVKVEAIDKRADELQKEINALREKQHGVIRENDRLQHEIRLIDEKINKVVDVEREYKKKEDELNARRQEFKKSTLELNKRLDEDSIIAVQLSRSRTELHKLNEEITSLRARDFGISERKLGDIAVSKILELKARKRGIYGTVAELGNASSKYSVALEVAAGPRLKSIVVDDDRTAAECIKYLKDNRLGTATFLPLTKLEDRGISQDVRKLADSRGSHGLAISLVEFDSKFKKVFSYVLANTIIVDDIDVALRLGVGNAKFVTLDGDVAEMSGVMHGGYREKKKHSVGFREKELSGDIEKAEARMGEVKSTVDMLESKRVENEDLIKSLREKKAILEADIIKEEKLLELETGDTKVLELKKQDLRKNEKAFEDELRGISSQISGCNSELAQLKIEKQKLRNVITQMKNPTLLAEINTFEQKLLEFNEEILRLRSESKNADTQIFNIYAPEKSRTENIIKQLDRDELGFDAEWKGLEQDIGSDEKILMEKEEMFKEFYAKFRSLFEKRGKIGEEVQKNEFGIDKLIEESRQSEIKVNTFSIRRAEMSAVLAGMNAEFQQYEGVKLDIGRSEEELKADISKFERMQSDIGSVNMRALEIYEEVEKQYGELLDKKKTLTGEKEDVIGMMGEIEGKKKELFVRTFSGINENFKKFFGMLSTKGSEANLVLENEESPFEAGVRINVKIGTSKFLDIRSLSGGEKTMTALAFIFSMQEYEPASFYVLDEVDAALDKHNSEKLSKLIREYAKKAQYIMISHNDSVISESDILYGISMNEDGVSKVVSLKV